MTKLTDDEVRTLVLARFGFAMKEHEQLSNQREKAQDTYYGRPMGNEIDGRSQVVSKVLMDTVEWAMPSFMRIFTTSQAVQFDPVGPEDEELAKQESMYVSHVLWKKNDGFMLIYSWLKDGLYQKVGYVKYWWEDQEKVEFPTYRGLSADQLSLLLQDLEQEGEVEVLEADIGHTAPGVNQTFDVKLKVNRKYGCLKVEPVPPNEIVVSGDCRGSIKKAKFAGHLTKKTRSDLREMGFSRVEVEKVTDFVFDSTALDQARDPQGTAPEEDDGVDWATTELNLLDCWTYVDADGDGHAELRHFLMHGDGFLVNEEADEIQLESWTPIPVPHQHAGIDYYDLVEDQQRVDTGLIRGLLDNTYFSQNQRLIYDKNTINVQMLQVNRPGGHIANDGPVVGSVMPVPVNEVASRLLPVIQYTQETIQRRTGVGDRTTGVDADVLAQSTKGAYMQAVGAANQRLEAIARVFAETGLSRLYLSMHKMLAKHQDWPEKFRIKKDWVTANPSEWQERADLTVSVGLGTTGKEEVRANLGTMAQVIEQAAQVPGLVQPQNVYNLVHRFQTELGFEAEEFITDPSSEEYQQWAQQQQPQPDPYVEGKKIEGQTKLQEKQIDSRDKAMDRAQDAALKITEMELDARVDLAKPGIGAELARGGGAPGNAGQRAAGQPPPA